MSDFQLLNARAACAACAENHRRELAGAESGSVVNLHAYEDAAAMLEAAIDIMVETGLAKDDRYAEDAIRQRRNEMARQQAVRHA